MVVMPQPYSAFNSRTARIRRTAASPLLTTAMRLGYVTGDGWLSNIGLSEGKGHIGPGGYGVRLRIDGRLASWHRLVVGCHDGGIDSENCVACDRARTEP